MNNSKEINIKNWACYHFDDIIKIKGFDFDNILLHEKSYKNILVYNILCKTLIGAKPLRFRFDKVDGFIKAYDRTRYLVLFGLEKYDAIYNRIRYLISQESGITYVFSHNYARIQIDSDNFLPQKTLTLHKIIILIKPIFNENESHYYYNIFLVKCSYQLAEK